MPSPHAMKLDFPTNLKKEGKLKKYIPKDINLIIDIRVHIQNNIFFDSQCELIKYKLHFITLF